MISASADRNLLFGILALQLDFIQRDQLIAAMHAWVLAKERSLGEILVEQKALDGTRRRLLEPLVDEHLRHHGGDAQKSMAAAKPGRGLREELEKIADADLQASVGQVFATIEHSDAQLATASWVGESTSAGTRFQILRPHAKGGLGQVSVAQDRELNREVALKEIQERHAHDRGSQTRFLLEAEITGGLEHPGIVPVYGLGHYPDGRPFYAMRFIRGDSLKDAITRFHGRERDTEAMSAETGKQGESPWFQDAMASAQRRAERSGRADPIRKLEGERMVEFRQMLGRFVDVCQAVAYAHSRGVLHRDLKPANIMLGKYGETLVVDWGLAKVSGGFREARQENLRDADAPLSEAPLRPSSNGSLETVAGIAMGTPAYMSPEQAEGRLDLLSPASDVYSLGATLYHLLTGRTAFEANSLDEVMRKVRLGDFPGPRAAYPEVSRGLEAICLKSMALRSEDRYPTPKELAEDIERWLADEPVRAWPEPRSIRVKRWLGRHRVAVTSVAAVLIVATVALVAGNVLLSRANSDLKQANKEKEQANSDLINANRNTANALLDLTKANQTTENAYVEEKKARADAETARKLADAEKKLKESQLRRSEILLYPSTFREAFHHWRNSDFVAARERLDECQRNLRGPEFGFLASSCDRIVRLVHAHSGSVNCLAISLDGKRLLSGSGDTTIKVWDMEAGKVRFILRGHTNSVMSLALSPDGKQLYSGSGDATIKVWDLETGKETNALRGHTKQVTSLALSSDGKRLFSGSGDATIKVWDLEKRKEEAPLVGHKDVVTSLAMSSDGKRLVSGGFDKMIKVWDIRTGKETLSLGGNMEVTCLALTWDGKLLYSGGIDKAIEVWDLETGKQSPSLRGSTEGVTSLALSSDGRRLFSGSIDKTIKVWDLNAGKETLSLRGQTDWVTSLAVSSDGNRVYSGSWDKTTMAWDLAAGKETLSFPGHTNWVTSLALSSDGRRLFSASWDKTIRFWDLAAGKGTLSLLDHKSAITSLALSSDCNRLFLGGQDAVIKVWDLKAGKEAISLRGHTNEIRCLAPSPDGNRLFSGSRDKTIRVWDLESGKESHRLLGHTDEVRCLALSPDGRRLYSGSFDKTIKVWDLESGKELNRLLGHTDEVRCLVLSLDGKRAFSGGSDRTIKVWDLATGKETTNLRGHTDCVTTLVLSADGRRLFSASGDTTIKMWNLDLGKETLSLRGHTDWVTSLVLSADGKRFYSGSGDTTIKAWNLE